MSLPNSAGVRWEGLSQRRSARGLLAAWLREWRHVVPCAGIGHGPGATVGLSWVPKKMGLPFLMVWRTTYIPQVLYLGQRPLHVSLGVVSPASRGALALPISGFRGVIWKTAQPNHLANGNFLSKKRRMLWSLWLPIIFPNLSASLPSGCQRRAAWSALVWGRSRRCRRALWCRVLVSRSCTGSGSVGPGTCSPRPGHRAAEPLSWRSRTSRRRPRRLPFFGYVVQR